MKIILQRVLSASVTINSEITAQIDRGYLVLLGVSKTDTFEEADKFIQKIKKLRIFDDENGKTNLSIDDVSGEVLIVSQFTLYADCKKGNRPSFINAAGPELAESVYDYFVEKSIALFKRVECGKFGEDMKVSLVNDGPFTIVLESD